MEKIILNEYGIEKQLRQMQEECGELVAAINHYLRDENNTSTTYSIMFLEVCDLTNLIEQFKLMFPNDSIERLRRQKLIREIKRINSKK